MTWVGFRASVSNGNAICLSSVAQAGLNTSMTVRFSTSTEAAMAQLTPMSSTHRCRLCKGFLVSIEGGSQTSFSGNAYLAIARIRLTRSASTTALSFRSTFGAISGLLPTEAPPFTITPFR